MKVNYLLGTLYVILYAIAILAFYWGSLLIASLAVLGVGLIVCTAWLGVDMSRGEEERDWDDFARLCQQMDQRR